MCVSGRIEAAYVRERQCGRLRCVVEKGGSVCLDVVRFDVLDEVVACRVDAAAAAPEAAVGGKGGGHLMASCRDGTG